MDLADMAKVIALNFHHSLNDFCGGGNDAICNIYFEMKRKVENRNIFMSQCDPTNYKALWKTTSEQINQNF